MTAQPARWALGLLAAMGPGFWLGISGILIWSSIAMIAFKEDSFMISHCAARVYLNPLSHGPFLYGVSLVVALAGHIRRVVDSVEASETRGASSRPYYADGIHPRLGLSFVAEPHPVIGRLHGRPSPLH